MIFSQSTQGAYIVDGQTLREIENYRKPTTDSALIMLGDEPTEVMLDHDEGDVGATDDSISTVTTAVEPLALRRKRRLFGTLPVKSDGLRLEDTTADVPATSGIEGSSGSSHDPARARAFPALSSWRARTTGYQAQAPLQSGDDEHDISLHNPVRGDTQIVEETEQDNDEDALRRIPCVSAVTRRRRNKYATVTTTSPSYGTQSAEDASDHQRQQHENALVPAVENLSTHVEDDGHDDLSL